MDAATTIAPSRSGRIRGHGERGGKTSGDRDDDRRREHRNGERRTSRRNPPFGGTPILQVGQQRRDGTGETEEGIRQNERDRANELESGEKQRRNAHIPSVRRRDALRVLARRNHAIEPLLLGRRQLRRPAGEVAGNAGETSRHCTVMPMASIANAIANRVRSSRKMCSLNIVSPP